MKHIENGDLSAYLAGELSESESTSIRDHLTSCAECRRFHERLSSMHSELDSLPGSPAFVSVVMTKVRIEEQRSTQPSWSDRITAWLLPAATACAASVLVVTVWTSSGNSDEMPVLYGDVEALFEGDDSMMEVDDA